MNYLKMNELLKEANSKYYCGSSCLLSLFAVYQEIEKTSDSDFKKAFSKFKLDVLSLFEKDSRLFELSKKNEELSELDWKEIEDVFLLYEEVIFSLKELIDFVSFTKKKAYLLFLKRDLDFLVDLALDNLNLFALRTDIPDSFYPVRNVVFQAIKKEFRYPLYDEAGSIFYPYDVILPILAMLYKLLNRKQNGKKPFSEGFLFSEKVNSLQNCEESLKRQRQEKRVDQEKNRKDFFFLSSVAKMAKEEVKMESLKKDYQYLSDILLLASRQS